MKTGVVSGRAETYFVGLETDVDIEFKTVKLAIRASDRGAEVMRQEALLANQVLLFYADENPTEDDTSFAKQFYHSDYGTMNGETAGVGRYEKENKTGYMLYMDWAESFQITGPTLATLINIT